MIYRIKAEGYVTGRCQITQINRHIGAALGKAMQPNDQPPRRGRGWFQPIDGNVVNCLGLHE
jgi:hypothetical protein